MLETNGEFFVKVLETSFSSFIHVNLRFLCEFGVFCVFVFCVFCVFLCFLCFSLLSILLLQHQLPPPQYHRRRAAPISVLLRGVGPERTKSHHNII